jgi:ADP-ribose pyrophosphatase
MSTVGSRPEVRVIAAGRHLTLVEEDGWEYVTRSGVTGVVVIVALTEDDKLVLVEQPRTPIGRHVIELPAGLVGDAGDRRSESLAEAARRELEEETGYAARELVLLAEGPVAVGVADEVVTFFQARGLSRVGAGGGDASEQIRVHEIALPELRAFLAAMQRAGLAVDPKIYAGLFLIGARAPLGGAEASR